MNNYKVVLEAANKHEFVDVLEGKNGYRYEDRLCSGPTDVGMVLYCIYKIYREIDKKIADVFAETLKKMISDTSHDVYYATEYILYQVERESRGKAPFSIDSAYFEQALRERIAKDKRQFLCEKTLENLPYSDGEAISLLAKELKEFGMNIE